MSRTNKRILFITLPIIVLLAALVWYFCFCTTSVNKLSDYQKRRANAYYPQVSAILPALTDLPTYTHIDYQYRKTRALMFRTETMRLVVTYDHATYESEKNKLNKKQYLDHVVYDDIGNFCIIPEYEFSINSYHFRILPNDDEDYPYPHTIGLIATSDEKNSIAYLYLFDGDLDCIGDGTNAPGSMATFIKTYFKYDW